MRFAWLAPRLLLVVFAVNALINSALAAEKGDGATSETPEAADIQSRLQKLESRSDLILAAITRMETAIKGMSGSAKEAPVDPKSCAPAAGEEPEVNPYGRVFTNDELTIEMASYVGAAAGKTKAEMPDALLKIKGGPAFEHGLDGRVRRYQASRGGDGLDYRGWHDGKEIVRMTMRKGYRSHEEFEVHLGRRTYKVRLDAERTKSMCAYTLLREYKAGAP